MGAARIRADRDADPMLALTWLTSQFEIYLASLRGGAFDQEKIRRHVRAVSYKCTFKHWCFESQPKFQPHAAL